MSCVTKLEFASSSGEFKKGEFPMSFTPRLQNFDGNSENALGWFQLFASAVKAAGWTYENTLHQLQSLLTGDANIWITNLINRGGKRVEISSEFEK